MYISNKISHKVRTDLSNGINSETAWVDLLLPRTRPITVGVFYRPPNDTTFLESFHRTLLTLDTNSESIILGDMNICFNNNDGSLTKRLKQTLAINNHKQLITTPTRLTENTATTLDHIICNREDKIAQSGVIETGFSDHFITYCTRKTPRVTIGKHRTIKIRSLRNYNIETYTAILQNTDWSLIYESINVNEAWLNFKTIITDILDMVAPVKKIRIKNRTDPWINNEILHLMEQRDKLMRRFSKNKNDRELKQEFNRIRTKVDKNLKKAKGDYFSNKAEEYKNTPKKLWKHLKETGYSTKPKDHSDIILNINGETCHDTLSIANHFNTFFTTVAAQLAQNLPHPFNKYSTNTSTFREYYRNKGIVPNALRLQAVTERYTFKELKRLNPYKSTGPDNIPAKFLKDGAKEIAGPLTHIINLSISTESIPNELKEAMVTPLFKKGDKLEVSNYRPVSILCIVSKILERAIYSQVEQHLKENNILFMFQSGFRDSYSTDTCLIHLTDFIRSQMAKGNYVGMVLLDLQKAFDTVNHEILCDKLAAMGIGSIGWFKSYLSGRTQKVKIGDIESDPKPITCGVPQGSILGPLLFLCYVNDMELSTDTKLLLYADDSALIVPGKDPKVIADTLSRNLESCREWLVDNRLSLHLGKTEAVLCGSKRKLQKENTFTVTCNGTPINSVPVVKYLGIKIEADMSGDAIKEGIINKCTSRIKFLYRQARCLPTATKKTLCLALVQCHLDYAISSWYSALSQKAKSSLQILQNKMLRFILNLEPTRHIGQDELQSLEMLRVPDRAKQLRLNHVHKIFNNSAPEYLKEHFTKNRGGPLLGAAKLTLWCHI